MSGRKRKGEIPPENNHCTIAQVIEHFEAVANDITPNSVRRSIWCLRTVARLAGLDEGSHISLLNMGAVRRFQNAYCAGKGDSARVSCNSILIAARSILKRDRVYAYREMGLQVPDMTGLKEARALRVESRQYQLPDRALVDRLLSSVPVDRRLHGVHLLAAHAGLRAREIAACQPSWIGQDNGRWFVAVPAAVGKGRKGRFAPISADVAASLLENVFKQITPHCRRWHKAPGEGGEYFVPGCSPAQRYSVAVREYSAWVESMGLSRRMKAHEMRKIRGSVLYTDYGPAVAQWALGHASPNTTARIYAAQTRLPEIVNAWSQAQNKKVAGSDFVVETQPAGVHT